MPVPQATLDRVAKLQPDATSTKGIKVIVGGDGTRFFLIKDTNDLWGLWQGTSAGIEVVYAPLPGLKHGDCDAVIPWDGLMVVYALSRVIIGTTNYHPLHHIELSAPQFKAQVWRSQIDAANNLNSAQAQQIAAQNTQNATQAQQIAALTQKVVELERGTPANDLTEILARLAKIEALLFAPGPSTDARLDTIEEKLQAAGAALA